MITIICPCGRAISTTPCRAKRKRYCSKKCFYKFRKRPSGLKYILKVENPSWFKRKDQVKLDGKGYERRRINGIMRRVHDEVLEIKIGRKLKKNEVCHHINGIKNDNRPENLKLMLKTKHDKLHNGKKI